MASASPSVTVTTGWAGYKVTAKNISFKAGQPCFRIRVSHSHSERLNFHVYKLEAKKRVARRGNGDCPGDSRTQDSFQRALC